MNCLLDTATFLWLITDLEEKISRKALKTIQTENLVLSTVSLWEIAIKYSIGKLFLEDHPQKWLPDVILRMGLQQLPIAPRHVLEVIELPHYHGDPFDRLLISQAKIEELPIITPDPVFKKYKVNTIW